jgi:hypothetical protein
MKEQESLGFVRGGRLHIHEDTWHVGDGMVSVIVTKITDAESRGFSPGQRAYYFGVVLKHIAEHTGYSVPEAHEVMKAMHLPKEDGHNGTVIEGLVVGGSITKLRGEQPKQYLDEIIRWAAEALEVAIPDSDPNAR